MFLVSEHSLAWPWAKLARTPAPQIRVYPIGLPPALATVAANEAVHQGIIQFPHHKIAAWISIKSMEPKRSQLPVPKVRGQEKEAAALALGALVILKPVVDDELLNVVAIPTGKMGIICQHPAEILEEAKDNFASFSLRPVRKRQAQVEQSDAAQTRPEKVGDRREHGADPARNIVGQQSECGEHQPQRPVLHSMREGHPPRIRRLFGGLWRMRKVFSHHGFVPKRDLFGRTCSSAFSRTGGKGTLKRNSRSDFRIPVSPPPSSGRLRGAPSPAIAWVPAPHYKAVRSSRRVEVRRGRR